MVVSASDSVHFTDDSCENSINCLNPNLDGYKKCA
jgi:hypothetical protein